MNPAQDGALIYRADLQSTLHEVVLYGFLQPNAAGYMHVSVAAGGSGVDSQGAGWWCQQEIQICNSALVAAATVFAVGCASKWLVQADDCKAPSAAKVHSAKC